MVFPAFQLQRFRGDIPGPADQLHTARFKVGTFQRLFRRLRDIFNRQFLRILSGQVLERSFQNVDFCTRFGWNVDRQADS